MGGASLRARPFQLSLFEVHPVTHPHTPPAALRPLLPLRHLPGGALYLPTHFAQAHFHTALNLCCRRSHHICLEVPDMDAAVAHVGQRVRLLDKQPRAGAHGLPVVFAHPKDMCGVLTELEEVKH